METCSVVELLQSTNETYNTCGIPVRDQSATLIGVVASIGSLALIMVIMRLVDRAVSAQARLGWDDLLIGLSGVCHNLPTFTTYQTISDTYCFLGLVYRNECACYRGSALRVRERYVGDSTRPYHRKSKVAVCRIFYVHDC